MRLEGRPALERTNGIIQRYIPRFEGSHNGFQFAECVFKADCLQVGRGRVSGRDLLST